jgi:hypothetical protein
MDTPTTEPTSIRAGDTVTWLRELADYSAADGWALKYKLLYAAGTAVAISSTGVGTTHTVSLSAATTAAFIAGAATLAGYVEKGSGGSLQRVTLDSTAVTILPDLSAATTFDGRSANLIALEAARAALASYMSKGQIHVAEYDIAGRQMKFRSAAEITDLIRHYEIRVSRESGLFGGRMLVNFR